PLATTTLPTTTRVPDTYDATMVPLNVSFPVVCAVAGADTASAIPTASSAPRAPITCRLMLPPSRALVVADGERDGAAVAGGGLDDLDLPARGPVSAGAARDRPDLDGRRAVEELHRDLPRRQHEGSLAGRLGLGRIGHRARETVVSDL